MQDITHDELPNEPMSSDPDQIKPLSDNPAPSAPAAPANGPEAAMPGEAPPLSDMDNPNPDLGGPELIESIQSDAPAPALAPEPTPVLDPATEAIGDQASAPSTDYVSSDAYVSSEDYVSSDAYVSSEDYAGSGDYVSSDAYISGDEYGEPEPEPEPEIEPLDFNLRDDPIPSFGALQQVRGLMFKRSKHVESFRNSIEELGTDGEEGRRRGLGLWMVGDYAESADQLASHDGDDVASFTRANALMSAQRATEALPVFQRLSEAYPDEPRPRGGFLESQLESNLANDDQEKALADLDAGLASAPASFGESAEGHYLRGRSAELRTKWEEALENYSDAIEIDPTHRQALRLGAELSERFGLDDDALMFYQELTRLLPIDKSVMMNLGILYEDMGLDQRAAACYEVVVKCCPTDERARLYLADAIAGMQMHYDEDLERKEDRLNQILRTPITDFELSVRARNCLSKMNLITLGDLVRKTEQELLSYKNFGETSLNEIKEILVSKNLRLGMAHEEAVASIESLNRGRATGENAEMLNRSIADLELSIRARRTVENLGCLTIGDVLAHSEDELLGMPNFGQTSLQELKRKLTENNLSLRAKDKKRKK